MTKEQLKKERILTKISLNEIGLGTNSEYKSRLMSKLTNIEENFKIKTSSALINYKFIGLASYDLRVLNIFLNYIKYYINFFHFFYSSKTLSLKKCLR